MVATASTEHSYWLAPPANRNAIAFEWKPGLSDGMVCYVWQRRWSTRQSHRSTLATQPSRGLQWRWQWRRRRCCTTCLLQLQQHSHLYSRTDWTVLLNNNISLSSTHNKRTCCKIKRKYDQIQSNAIDTILRLTIQYDSCTCTMSNSNFRIVWSLAT